jgi:hypothetical protein
MRAKASVVFPLLFSFVYFLRLLSEFSTRIS